LLAEPFVASIRQVSMSHPQRDSGFTLIELLVVISLMGVMMAIAVTGWNSWARASEHKGAARELQSVLRQTQQRAVTEGQTMCVDFDVASNSYWVTEGVCGVAGAVVMNSVKVQGTGVAIKGPEFTPSADPDTVETGVTFYSRGTAWSGHVYVVRSGSTKLYKLSVEGLTGRVSLD
jgi:type II secretion system protein H